MPFPSLGAVDAGLVGKLGALIVEVLLSALSDRCGVVVILERKFVGDGAGMEGVSRAGPSKGDGYPLASGAGDMLAGLGDRPENSSRPPI